MQTIAGLYLSLGPVQINASAWIIMLAAFALATLVALLLAAMILNERVYDWARRAGRRHG